MLTGSRQRHTIRPVFPAGCCVSLRGKSCPDGGEKGDRMSFLRRGERRRGKVAAALTTVGALAAFQALAIVGAGVASAATALHVQPRDRHDQHHDRRRRHRRAVMVETAAADVDPAAAPGSILFDDGARLPGVWQRVEHEHRLDRRPRPAEQRPRSFVDRRERRGDPFNTAIAWHIDLGTGAGDQLTFDLNCDQDNTLVLTDTSFNLNGGVGEVLGGRLATSGTATAATGTTCSTRAP